MKTIISVIMLVISAQATAEVGFNQGNHLVFHVASRHSSDQELNEANPGLSVRYGIDSLNMFVTGGFYKNSYYKNSTYAGVGKTFFSVGPVAFSLVGGAATGYIERLTPALIPEVSIHYNKTSFIVGYIPGVQYRDTITIPAFTFSVATSF